MATDTPSSSDPDSGPGDKQRPEKKAPKKQPRIALRKLPPGRRGPPSENSAETPPKPRPESESEPPKPLPRQPHHLGTRPVKAAPEATEAPLSTKEVKKGKTAPALKPRAYGSAPAGEDKGDKKGPKQEKKDSKRPLFLVALLAITAAGFLVPWNPLSPFSEGKRNEPVWKEEGAPLPAGHGAEATAPQPPAADPGQPSGAAPEPLDAAEKGGPEPRIKTVAGLLQQLRTVPLHVSREPRGLFIDRVFYPLDSVIEPETGLRLISLQPDIRRPVAVFLTPDGQPHSLPLPENRP